MSSDAAVESTDNMSGTAFALSSLSPCRLTPSSLAKQTLRHQIRVGRRRQQGAGTIERAIARMATTSSHTAQAL